MKIGTCCLSSLVLAAERLWVGAWESFTRGASLSYYQSNIDYESNGVVYDAEWVKMGLRNTPNELQSDYNETCFFDVLNLLFFVYFFHRGHVAVLMLAKYLA